ncbi:hypothetical protein [Brevundimonas sp.]|uniref:hypothetical protein n=1 Tax=Brevundimonas sp. TaxID=1871086 RepID=UPI002AB95277|nr:hypothetical protein [Brevundimonas sp.]MDZ4109130.1 hypothetical protein [Brevundimonas sp.]MDZ4321164.1 hypothetical protein [Phenylobacterium sp.]HWQ85990.1 hypothetical protein [Brevundimonas sp.]
MRKTAIILAGAAIFDLGVIVVSVQAQESSRPSPGTVVAAPGTTPNRDHIDQDAQRTACANGKHIPDARLSACRATPSDPSGPASQTRAVDMFLKIDADFTARACMARRGEVVRHEGVQQCRLPAPGDLDIHKQGVALNFTKIDIHYTARACIAQRGEVVTRDGVQQCALPAEPGNNRAGPSRR